MRFTSFRRQPKSKQLFLFSGDNVNCHLITWYHCKQWKFRCNNALIGPGPWLVYYILKDKQPGWMCTEAAGSEIIVWSESGWSDWGTRTLLPRTWAAHWRFVCTEPTVHRCTVAETKTQLDEMRPRQKNKGASKMICKSVICRFVTVSDSSVRRCVKDEKLYIWWLFQPRC